MDFKGFLKKFLSPCPSNGIILLGRTALPKKGHLNPSSQLILYTNNRNNLIEIGAYQTPVGL